MSQHTRNPNAPRYDSDSSKRPQPILDCDIFESSWRQQRFACQTVWEVGSLSASHNFVPIRASIEKLEIEARKSCCIDFFCRLLLR